MQKWFVHQGGSPWYTYSDTVAWCGGLGYRVPQVKELTNAVCGSFYRCQGAVGATPPSMKGNLSSQLAYLLVGKRFMNDCYNGYHTNYPIVTTNPQLMTKRYRILNIFYKNIT
ncbi:hypothetical protein, partial [Gilliamella sp. Pas-s25]|uniref:hypothetical protein n=1 Tax=Gilliamella sp. Pas-s25 TaxID=2687310 RepID=UPI00136538DD